MNTNRYSLLKKHNLVKNELLYKVGGGVDMWASNYLTAWWSGDNK